MRRSLAIRRARSTWFAAVALHPQDDTMAIALDQDFPRTYAQTDRFRRGVPRTFEVTDDHVTFLRSDGPFDATLSLWRLDLASGVEQRNSAGTEATGGLPPETCCLPRSLMNRRCLSGVSLIPRIPTENRKNIATRTQGQQTQRSRWCCLM